MAAPFAAAATAATHCAMRCAPAVGKSPRTLSHDHLRPVRPRSSTRAPRASPARRGASVVVASSAADADAADALRALVALRPRQDVLEPDTRLRSKLPPRRNPWSDGYPYVPDDDLVCLRVVHHGSTALDGWANAGGCRYDDDGCPTLYGMEGYEADSDAVGRELPADDDARCTPDNPGACNAAAGLPQLPASWAVRGGPRETIYFDAAEVRAAIVTVGGLCPGLNDITRGLVQSLEASGVRKGNILGIRYGFRGFYSRQHPPITLTSEVVDSIHLAGGTMLGTSRGGSDVKRIVDAIADMQLSFVFVVGGNGGNAAVVAINAECAKRDMNVAIVGLPKSIDNDILLVDSCFGFNTAVGEATRAILAANVEARSMHHGVGLVKLMGRSSGFIAAQASVASGEVDVCLIPEVPFNIDAVLDYIYTKLRTRGHCTVVVAEGVAQDTLRAEMARDSPSKLPAETDASGNPVLLDAGRWLKAKIKAAARPAPPGASGDCDDGDGGGIVPDIKYIEPAYTIRSVPANTVDKAYCRMLSYSAVHGAFAGFSGFTAGVCSNHYTYLPAAEVVRSTRRMDPRGRLYRMMRAALDQPEFS